MLADFDREMAGTSLRLVNQLLAQVSSRNSQVVTLRVRRAFALIHVNVLQEPMEICIIKWNSQSASRFFVFGYVMLITPQF